MKKYTENEILEFLFESNKIERIYDASSLMQAKYAWDYLVTVKKLTISDILKTHKIMSIDSNLMPDEKGFFRRAKVWIGGREAINYQNINKEIEHFVMNINNIIINGKKESKIFLEGIIKKHHIEYERIHPFTDFNGRTGRLIMNWERISVGLPILLIIADYPKEDGNQIKYYEWFKN